MKISFACPSCDAGGSVDASAAGRKARCKHCGHRFTIPTPGVYDAELDGYQLDEPTDALQKQNGSPSPVDTTFVRSRGGEHARSRPRPGRNATGPNSRPTRKRASHFPWKRRVLQGGIGLLLTLTAISSIAPNGIVIAGCILLVLGMAMVLIGYSAGAYGAFTEDSLYGFLYVLIPLYAAYYIVSRWEDLWIWFTCSTVGVGLVLLGTEVIRWGGITV